MLPSLHSFFDEWCNILFKYRPLDKTTRRIKENNNNTRLPNFFLFITGFNWHFIWSDLNLELLKQNTRLNSISARVIKGRNAQIIFFGQFKSLFNTSVNAPYIRDFGFETSRQISSYLKVFLCFWPYRCDSNESCVDFRVSYLNISASTLLYNSFHFHRELMFHHLYFLLQYIAFMLVHFFETSFSMTRSYVYKS